MWICANLHTLGSGMGFGGFWHCSPSSRGEEDQKKRKAAQIYPCRESVSEVEKPQNMNARVDMQMLIRLFCPLPHNNKTNVGQDKGTGDMWKWRVIRWWIWNWASFSLLLLSTTMMLVMHNGPQLNFTAVILILFLCSWAVESNKFGRPGS